MRRILAVIALLSSILIVATGYSRAQIIPIAKGCLSEPGNIPTACPATLVPTVPVDIEKTLQVGSGASQALGITDYRVKVTSRVACFTLDEPIDVGTLGSDGAAFLSPATPGTFPVQNPNLLEVHANDQGEADLLLEVWDKDVGPEGLGVKAVWPLENVDRYVQVYQPATPTATPVGTPDLDTPTSVPTDTATPGPTSTPTPGPTLTPTPLPGPLTLKTCLSPNPVPAGSGATLYVRTFPGAVCSVSVLFDNGATTDSLGGGLQQVGPTGIAAFPFTADNTGSTMGLATATCTLADQTISQNTLFDLS